MLADLLRYPNSPAMKNRRQMEEVQALRGRS
jgi:hypothetical protein